jgi:hypothetical protein
MINTACPRQRVVCLKSQNLKVKSACLVVKIASHFFATFDF